MTLGHNQNPFRFWFAVDWVADSFGEPTQAWVRPVNVPIGPPSFNNPVSDWLFNKDVLGEAIAEVVPECGADLGAGVHQADESVAAVATVVALSSTTDLACGDNGMDVALGAIGARRNFRPVEHPGQFRFVGIQPR